MSTEFLQRHAYHLLEFFSITLLRGCLETDKLGLGIAFHAKPRVKESARQSISTIGLDGVLYFIGFKDSHLGEHGKL